MKNLTERITLDNYISLTKNNETKAGNYLLIGVLARTDKGTGLPYFDDLSHHMVSVAVAASKYRDKNLTLAALLHDFFKGLMVWKKTKRGKRWLHYHRDEHVMKEFFNKIK